MGLFASMRKRMAILAAFVLCGPVVAGEKSAAFLDKSQWHGLMEYWTIKGDTVIGSAPKGLKFNTFLCSKRPFRNFELKFEIQLKNGVGNSGIQIRSKIFQPKTFAVAGAQCDIGGRYWGCIYGEHIGGMMKEADAKVIAKILKPKEFNQYHIKCVGQHVTIKINGVTTVDGDFPKMAKTGIIAWQLHSGGPMEVTFRKIRFMELLK